ncbi:MAG: hypothetical protein O7H41_12895 [Planctomycetota bacterium]|nr:hypothetical protein [Planctomycetota bacterium]
MTWFLRTVGSILAGAALVLVLAFALDYFLGASFGHVVFWGLVILVAITTAHERAKR